MKKILLLLCVAFAGCGAKSNEEIAQDLIKEKLKTTIPDFNNYEAVNFGRMGTAFSPYEESVAGMLNLKAVSDCKDSITLLEKRAKEDKIFKIKLQQWQDSLTARNERSNAAMRVYIPEKLFKISHSYTIKDKSGIDKKTEEEFYIDKDLKKVVKVHKVY